MAERQFLDIVPKEELPNRIKQWLDLSLVRLTDDDIVTVDLRPIIYDAQEIRTFSRLVNMFYIEQMKYLFDFGPYDSYFKDFDGKFYSILKSNVKRYIYPNEITLNKYLSEISYHNGFEIIIKSSKKSNNVLTYEKIAHYADLLQGAIMNFNLLLKQDNILNDYTFKAAIYTKDDNDCYFDTKHISILLLNTKELIRVSR